MFGVMDLLLAIGVTLLFLFSFYLPLSIFMGVFERVVFCLSFFTVSVFLLGAYMVFVLIGVLLEGATTADLLRSSFESTSSTTLYLV